MKSLKRRRHQWSFLAGEVWGVICCIPMCVSGWRPHSLCRAQLLGSLPPGFDGCSCSASSAWHPTSPAAVPLPSVGAGLPSAAQRMRDACGPATGGPLLAVGTHTHHRSWSRSVPSLCESVSPCSGVTSWDAASVIGAVQLAPCCPLRSGMPPRSWEQVLLARRVSIRTDI